MNEQELRELLLIGLDYSTVHDDWVEPVEAALEGVTPEQAQWAPVDGKGIWDIVLHLALWNENIIERVTTGEKAYPADREPWPPVPEPATEEAWQAAKDRLRKSIADVRALIEVTPMEQMIGNAYGLGDILCRFIHCGYHLGQIVKIRECQQFPA